MVVLLLFAVMLTRAPIGASDDLDRPGWPAALIGGGAGLGLAALLVDAFRWTHRRRCPTPGTAERLGEQIFRSWVLPFEVLSVLLLAALVGAIVLSRPDIGEPPAATPRRREPGAPMRPSSRTSPPRCCSASACTAYCAAATRCWC